MIQLRASLVSLLALFVVGACSSSSSDGGSSPGQTPGQKMCASLEDQVLACGTGTPCDDALVKDCAGIVGLVSDPFIEATRTCLDGGGSPGSCLASS